jgi:uncharacterized protein YcbK (DUF882 family)
MTSKECIIMAIKAYSKSKDGNKKLSANFRVREFACSDGSDPIFIDSELVNVLQKIRNHFGRAVTITSAYRTPGHNKACNGTAYSQHLYGRAADIRIAGVKPGQIVAYAEKLMPQSGGIGSYDTFVHIDVRSPQARWKG